MPQRQLVGPPFETTDRIVSSGIWKHATAAFDSHRFIIEPLDTDATLGMLLEAFQRSELHVGNEAKAEADDDEDDCGLSRSMSLGKPFNLTLDWWAASRKTVTRPSSEQTGFQRHASEERQADACLGNPGRIPQPPVAAGGRLGIPEYDADAFLDARRPRNTR